jgi:transglutaminase-like putative cysteine protease
MKYRIVHKTEYAYQGTVSHCYNQGYLMPRASPGQTCLASELWITPRPSTQQERLDFFGNRASYFAIHSPHQSLSVTAISQIEIMPPPQLPLPANSPAWESVRGSLPTDCSREGLEARGYVLPSPFIAFTPAIEQFARESFTPQRPLLDAALDLTKRIYQEFKYDPQFTTIVTPLSEVLKHRRGVCQDFAHLAIACARSLGLAARYVSGYLETLPPPGKTKLRGADASHAWFSIYLPGQGWADFDPTNNQIPSGQHLTIAWGRDYGDVAPLTGIIFGGGSHTLAVSVDVERQGEMVE